MWNGPGPFENPIGQGGGIGLGPQFRGNYSGGAGRLSNVTPGGAIINAIPGGPGNQGTSVAWNALEVFSRMGFVNLNGEQIETVDDASRLVLPATPLGFRTLLTIRNSSSAAQVMYICFGANATLNSVYRFEQDEIMHWDGGFVPQDDMYVIMSAAGGQISITYGQMTVPEIPPFPSIDPGVMGGGSPSYAP